MYNKADLANIVMNLSAGSKKSRIVLFCQDRIGSDGNRILIFEIFDNKAGLDLKSYLALLRLKLDLKTTTCFLSIKINFKVRIGLNLKILIN